MIETVVVEATNELVQLLEVNEPLWIKSSTDGRATIHGETYNMCYPKINQANIPLSWIESSKESEIVSVTALNLVNIFQDPRKWMDFFPTIVTNAGTLHVIDTENHGGSLYLMHERLHALSPFVAPREFTFFRYIRQLSLTKWLIVQVSYDLYNKTEDTSSHAFMLPSGCMIEDISNGKSKVTWIEHVLVNDNSLTHPLYEDVVRHSYAYGAKRWLVTLERMCERQAFSEGLNALSGHSLERVIDAQHSRTRMANLAHNMVKSFNEMLSMGARVELSQLPQSHNGGLRVSYRRIDFAFANNQPKTTMLCVDACIRLPISKESLFHFLKEEEGRPKWDVLANGSPVREIAHISIGNNPGNAISVMQPYVTKQSHTSVILQESCIDALGAFLIYAPVEYTAVSSIIIGRETEIAMVPSGFVITSDNDGVDVLGAAASSSNGPSTRRSSRASLLSMVLQIPVPSINAFTGELDMGSVKTIHAIVKSRIENLRKGIGC